MVRTMNIPPLESGRGISDQLDQLDGQVEDDDYREFVELQDNPLSGSLKHKITDQGTANAVYASMETFELMTTPPNEGFYDVELFHSTEEWLACVQERE